jgi:hypothetical protein
MKPLYGSTSEEECEEQLAETNYVIVYLVSRRYSDVSFTL